MTIESKKILNAIRQNDLITTRQLATQFDIPEEQFESFVKQLFDLQAVGEILRLPDRGWSLPERTGCLVGRIVLTRGGNGFVQPVHEALSEQEFFVPQRSTAGAFSGDLVVMERLDSQKEGRGKRKKNRRGGSDKSPRGRVLDVVQRRERLVRGRFHDVPSAKGKEAAGYVDPLERDAFSEIFIAAEDRNGAVSGQKVFVKLLDGWGPGAAYSRGRVEHVIHDEGSYESDLLAIATEFSLPLEMDREAEASAEKLPSPDDPKTWEGREDLTGLRIFTIDPDDAKDFDDAISLEVLEDGVLRLGVHIADVSAYVHQGSRIDEVAYERGTSVYLPGRVLPMLPERISNFLASLRPGEPKLTKSVFMDFDSHGDRIQTRICRGVIKSQRRFTYDEILAVLYDLDPAAKPANSESEDLPLPEDAEEYKDIISHAARLRDLLYQGRLDRGCLELEVPTVRLQLDSTGEMQKITREGRDPSHHLIEEFMLACNEAVAEFFIEQGLPLISRIHRPPEDESFDEFLDFLSSIDPKYKKIERPNIKELQALLMEVGKQPYSGVVNLRFLRSLSHAEYAPEAGLHFALSTESYCHFTSPIRRYPDLIVHRVLESYLLSGKPGPSPEGGTWEAALKLISKQSSELERKAEKAERELTKTRLIRYLEDKVGEEMDAVIVSVSNNGMFVQVEEILFDGFVHVSTLGPDYYEFDKSDMSLTGARSQRSFKIGDRVRVELTEVDPDVREVSFEIVKKLKSKF